MKFFKQHKTLTIILLIIIAILLALAILRDTVNFDESTAVYGNRTDGVEKVKITDKQKKEIENAIKNKSTKTTVRMAGRLVNVTVYTKKDTSLEDAKAIGPTVLGILSDEQKQFFDVQFLIDNSDNQKQFPIIGYKHHSRDGITWTKDR